MPSTPIRFLAASLCLMALGASACSSSDDKSASGVSSTSTTATTSKPAGDQPDGDSDDNDSGSPSESPCTKDSNYLSGTSTIVFTSDSKSPAKTADVTAENTLSLDEGALTPGKLEVDVNEPFAVTSTAGTDITGIIVGCATGQTTIASVPSGFVITEAGTYDIVDELADKTIGTVTVG